ncbi:MAG: phospho-N-acetylmuramoyl-pentapeptide-transferase [Deltaproteobacteria bacterium]|nr:phospho-N-acetylmuramoyl-pentapeptide-transferase [Deltaproteobacteria bacterium]
MLYHFLYPLSEYYTIFNVFQYITFRTIYATLTALVLSFLIGPFIIKKLQTLQIGEVIRTDGPPNHISKQGTPTMGGVIILIALISSVLLWSDLANRYIWLVLFVTVGMGCIGFADDYRKVVLKDKKGMGAAAKLSLQFVVSFLAAVFLYAGGFDTVVTLPFFKNARFDLGILYIPFVVLVITGTSNAVNLTDGLDGLAIGPITIASATYLVFAYVTGHVVIAKYLQIIYVQYSGELAVFAGAMAGASLGFLWFNAYPAQVFMGDIGALSLGGALGCIAIIIKHEAVLVIVGGIFVVEALSVIFQVASFKLRGKRVFMMAPIHHHYELKGWAEPKIIVRFWIIAVILALFALSTLKIR